jgi:hypothetical protein
MEGFDSVADFRQDRPVGDGAASFIGLVPTRFWKRFTAPPLAALALLMERR